MTQSRPPLAALSLALALLGTTAVARAEEAPRAVRLNQLGVEATGPKRAMLADPSTAPLAWTLRNAAGKTVAQGKTRVFGDDAASGDHVHQIDFSAVQAKGQGFQLTVGDRSSRPFAIGDRLYGNLKADALGFFYQNRSGIPIEGRFVQRPDLARPAGHVSDKATCFNKADERGQVWAGCDYTLDASRGWYDAGDHGKYLVNGGISVWTLLNAYERAQVLGKASTLAAFADGRGRIPENANGVSDLLDEARWELDFLLAMQVPAGKTLALPVGHQTPGPKGRLVLTEVDASGMAHQRLADERWTALPTAPAEDRETRYLYHPTTAATLNLAASAAQAARIWKTIDPAFSARSLEVARTAYAAARRNPEIYALGAFTGSGGYGDNHLDDEFYWAAAELFTTTGEASYEADLRASPLFLAGPTAGGTKATGDISWSAVGALGTVTLALAPNGLKPAEITAARANLTTAADRYLADGESQGYGLPYARPGYPWGSNSSILNRAMVLGLAADFTGKAAYRNGAADAMDYVLGRNPLDRSYVTGHGARPMQHPHHRFWAKQADVRYPAPPPGVLSGGPNSTSMGDPVAETMKGKCRPQTCWTDDYRSFTQNEVAVNWNAPLFWVATWLDEPSGGL
ncbi:MULTISPECIES: glycoside hydrolase family 9 protein [unclassified Caulobacter]|uniref:glycoside hydrolase family 9 protein n=1 Tax=unclassified Caulobacter TaxID=2648921 RepID=UPI000D342878|nr:MULTISPECIES: glycoside hydrolase family 9 protein [unclassified Caulobacter]PTS83202.1 glycosyl hydrolase [Caulobacter sp. HMWF009]PTT05364.1 glycosyl hydrolase [Caulobacter sp. HMWF025]